VFFVRKCFAQISLVTLWLCNFLSQNITEKFEHEMLMKLTIDKLVGTVEALRCFDGETNDCAKEIAPMGW